MSRGSFLTGFNSPLTRAWGFAVGSALALALLRFRVRSRAVPVWTAWLGAGLLLRARSLQSDQTPTPGPWTIVPVAGTMPSLLAGGSQPNRVSRALASRPMVKVGGHTVVLVLPLFDLGEKSQRVDPASCSTLSLLRGRCPVIERVSDVDPRQREARETIAQVAERTGSLLLDFSADQCPNDSCGSYSGSAPVYLDAHHISAEFSRSLADDFTRVLESS